MENRNINRNEIREDEFSSSLYNVVIGLVLLWGLVLNWFIVNSISVEVIMSINMFAFLGIYAFLCFVGVYMYNKSINPIISFIGYNFIVLPFGFIINIFIGSFLPGVVSKVLLITIIVTVILMVFGVVFTSFFEKISSVVTLSISLIIGLNLIQIYILHMEYNIFNSIISLIFCGYIGYNWGKANNNLRTLDNAVDSAAGVYMDMINTFIKFLFLMARKPRRRPWWFR